MSSQINNFNIPVLEGKKQINFGQAPVVMQYSQQPPMQGTGDVAATANNAVNNSYIANRARASQDNNQLAVTGIGAATWYGLSQGMEIVNNKYSTGDYNKTVYGKLGTLGDRFCTNTWIGRKLQGGIDSAKSFIERLSGKSKIVNSLAHHSTRPEWSMVKSAAKGPEGFLLTDCENILDEFLKPAAGQDRYTVMGHGFGGKVNLFQKLEQYGMAQKDINSFKDSVKGKPFAQQMVELQKKEIELLGGDMKKLKDINDVEVLKNIATDMKLKKLGISSLEEFNKMKGKFIDNPEKIYQIFDNASKDPNLKHISIWRNETTLFGKIKSHLFGRRVPFSEYRNKLMVCLGKGNKSTLGRALPKALAWLFEGGTNRFGGGKLGVVMQAGILADIIYNSVKAKGERIKTFAERCVNDFTYFIGMSVGVMLMHKAGGFKYAGLKDAKEVEEYRSALKDFNETKTKARVFGSKKEWKTALKDLEKKYLKYDQIKNPITKMLYKIGRFINTGNESAAYYRSNSKYNMNWLRAIANKNIIGVPVRFLIPMAMITPFLAKLTTTMAHKIFGRPTHSVLDEEEETDTTKDQEKIAGHDGQPFGGAQQQPQASAPVPPVNTPAGNPNTVNSQAPSPARTYVPSPDCGIPAAGLRNQKQLAPARTYVPSPEPAAITGPDMSTANAALAEADMTEKYINQTMASMK